MDHSSRLRQRAVIFLILTALLWSSGGVLIKWVDWNPIAIAGTRCAIAAMVMLAFRPKMKIHWGSAQLGAAICYSATVIMFVAANKMTTAANAILLQYTAPIHVAIFSYWFLGERVTKLDLATIAAAIGGMILFFMDGLSRGSLWGNVVAILSGISFAGTAMLVRKQKDTSSLESLFLGNVLTTLIGLPFIMHSSPEAKGWLGLILLGVFQLGFSYILFAEAMKHVTALEGILIPVLEPILNPIWVFLLLKERPGRWAFVGGIIVLVSVTSRCILAMKPRECPEI